MSEKPQSRRSLQDTIDRLRAAMLVAIEALQEALAAAPPADPDLDAEGWQPIAEIPEADFQ